MVLTVNFLPPQLVGLPQGQMIILVWT